MRGFKSLHRLLMPVSQSVVFSKTREVSGCKRKTTSHQCLGSTTGKCTGLLIRGLWVRIPRGALRIACTGTRVQIGVACCINKEMESRCYDSEHQPDHRQIGRGLGTKPQEPVGDLGRLTTALTVYLVVGNERITVCHGILEFYLGEPWTPKSTRYARK